MNRPYIQMLLGTLLLIGLGLTTVVQAEELFERTWLFEDSFQGWTIHGGKWTLEEGHLRHEDPVFNGGLVGLPGYHFSDIHLEADIQIPEVYWNQQTVWAGLIIRASAPVQHGGWHDGYLAFIRTNGLVNLVAHPEIELGEFESDLNTREETVRLGVGAIDDIITVYLNGEAVLSVEDDMYPSGEMALINYGNVATFANVTVEGTRMNLATPEPIVPVHPEPPQVDPVTPLPRIAVEKEPGERGRFYAKETGATFHPLGFNHTVLQHRSSGWHSTFNENTYDPEEMETTLSTMAALGANVIRVWLWGTQNEYGYTGSKESRGLNGAYMENVIDFLQRATRHGVYVMPIVDETPHNAYYDNVALLHQDETHDSKITGNNVQHLTRGSVIAKRTAIKDMIRYIQAADNGLLNTIFAWALSNEVNVSFNHGPYNILDGEVTTLTGKTYDLSDKVSRQASYDESILEWANLLAEGIKSLDPEALVSAGMWTSDAHARPPFNGLIPDDKDPRIPPRPSALCGPDSKLDFLDIHIYPWDRTAKVRPEAHEWDAVMASTLPAIVGEYGVFKHLDPPDKARDMLREMLEQAFDMGYIGALYWVWDLTEIEQQTWSAVEEGFGEFAMELKKELLKATE